MLFPDYVIPPSHRDSIVDVAKAFRKGRARQSCFARPERSKYNVARREHSYSSESRRYLDKGTGRRRISDSDPEVFYTRQELRCNRK